MLNSGYSSASLIKRQFLSLICLIWVGAVKNLKIGFLEHIDNNYPKTTLLRIVLDNYAPHISKETREWLAKNPNRFEFIFTPKQASWLNMIETFFGKTAKNCLPEIRIQSKDEFKKKTHYPRFGSCPQLS